ncbi:unnamed protein product [Dovyalis caffra]|uniref:3'-5' exonuclease domain-containing protein n=1 Tax=Dovyalis caffra TaxID=77055 RepID=A0AAV1RWS2_9ROSI|nr:unnamed protein product [Dovyalis caffra]
MEDFKLHCGYLGGNSYYGYDSFLVQCDDMYCYTVATSDPPCLFNWFVELFWIKLPNDGKRLRVSMDITWDQHSHNGNTKSTPVTLQFCHEICCIIFQVCPQENFPRSSLEHFLNHDYVDFFGFQMLHKVQYLRKAYNLVVKNWFDIPRQARLSNPARFRNCSNLSLQRMVCMDFWKWYAKPTGLLQSNWRLNKLSTDKIMYATLDCYLAYKLSVPLSIPRKIE